MLERSGCQLLAVHGRTRDQKDARAVRADWNAIKVELKSGNCPVPVLQVIIGRNEVIQCRTMPITLPTNLTWVHSTTCEDLEAILK